MFIAIILVLIIIALFFVNVPLLKQTQPQEAGSAGDREALNLQATRQQIKDIEKDVENDLIADDQLNSIRTEAENTLLLEMQAKAEPVRAVISARFYRLTALGLSIFIPVCALLVYLSVGTPAALLQTAEESSQPSMEELISRLEQRLAENPGDQEGWLVLAQTNMMLQRFDQAANAMEKLYQLATDSPDVLARYADTLTMANGGRFTDKAGELIEKALTLDPTHVHGLWLAGARAFQANDFDTAVRLFQKARLNINDPENLAQIDELIKAAREKAGANLQASPTAAPAAVNVTVELSEELKDDINNRQTVFVFAKAASGPPMPLAVSRHSVNELPLEVTLNDSMAMMPDLALSSFDEVVISARISSSGQAQAQAGDLQGESAVINPQTIDHVKITINSVVD